MKKSLAIALTAANAAPALAADWSGPYVSITGGYGTGEQSQRGGVLILPSRGGAKPQTVTGPGVTSIVTAPGTTSIVTSIVTAPASVVTVTQTQTITTTAFPLTADGRYGLSGGLVGGGVGYNWQRGRLVYGVESDGSWADISGEGACGVGSAVPHGCGGAIQALGTIRGNLGLDVPTGLSTFAGLRTFVAGGLAAADVKAWDSYFGNSGSKIIAGWTVGGGVEAMFGEHWSMRLEYLHVDLGDHAIFTALPPNPEHVRTTAELVRLGLSYRFNASTAPPVVARY